MGPAPPPMKIIIPYKLSYQVKELFNSWLDKNPGGKMTKTVFRETLAEVLRHIA